MNRDKPVRCSLWHWRSIGMTPMERKAAEKIDIKVHERCVRSASVKSSLPGRITMMTCVECHQLRMKETT